MTITIEIPTAFRRFTEGKPKIDCSAATIAEALNELTAKFPTSAATCATIRDRFGNS